jgi:hypothetical protein
MEDYIMKSESLLNNLIENLKEYNSCINESDINKMNKIVVEAYHRVLNNMKGDEQHEG